MRKLVLEKGPDLLIDTEARPKKTAAGPGPEKKLKRKRKNSQKKKKKKKNLGRRKRPHLQGETTPLKGGHVQKRAYPNQKALLHRKKSSSGQGPDHGGKPELKPLEKKKDGQKRLLQAEGKKKTVSHPPKKKKTTTGKRTHSPRKKGKRREPTQGKKGRSPQYGKKKKKGRPDRGALGRRRATNNKRH